MFFFVFFGLYILNDIKISLLVEKLKAILEIEEERLFLVQKKNSQNRFSQLHESNLPQILSKTSKGYC